ncbi:hypothetical protein F5Y11DRAFT_366913 [Daldinia sp. FL1419]|nr:hypothetical protein F5Y11DRAFT_366913 [Daldinia sp. FL1419]
MAGSEMINQGLTQVYTGLGILLGAGHIGNETHKQIMGLVHAGQNCSPNATAATNSAFTTVARATTASSSSQGPGRETPASMRSQDLLGLANGFAHLSTSNSIQSLDMEPENEHAKIICPWWSTPGYNCRDDEKGVCPFVHENIPGGLREPLICHFWADGDRCTKTADACLFAHCQTVHKVTAPAPPKKRLKNASPVMDDSEHFATPRPTLLPKGNEGGQWHQQSRP